VIFLWLETADQREVEERGIEVEFGRRAGLSIPGRQVDAVRNTVDALARNPQLAVDRLSGLRRVDRDRVAPPIGKALEGRLDRGGRDARVALRCHEDRPPVTAGEEHREQAPRDGTEQEGVDHVHVLRGDPAPHPQRQARVDHRALRDAGDRNRCVLQTIPEEIRFVVDEDRRADVGLLAQSQGQLHHLPLGSAADQMVDYVRDVQLGRPPSASRRFS
jgi:hypothetical protein